MKRKLVIEFNVGELPGRASKGSICVNCKTVEGMMDVASNMPWKCLYASVAGEHGAIGAYCMDDHQIRATLMYHYSEISVFIGDDMDKLRAWMTAAFARIEDLASPAPESFNQGSEEQS